MTRKLISLRQQQEKLFKMKANPNRINIFICSIIFIAFLLIAPCSSTIRVTTQLISTNSTSSDQLATTLGSMSLSGTSMSNIAIVPAGSLPSSLDGTLPGDHVINNSLIPTTYQFSYQVNSVMLLSWSIVDNGNSLAIKMNRTGRGWFAIGFDPLDSKMYYSDIFAATILNNTLIVDDYWSTDEIEPKPDVEIGGIRSILAFRSSMINGDSTVEFVRPLWAEDNTDNNIFRTSIPTVFAYGSTDFITKHIMTPTILSINFYTGKVSTPSLTGKQAHGVLMFISWGVLFPLAAMLGRYGKPYLKNKVAGKELWFLIHFGVQIFSIILAIIAFIIIFFQVTTHYATHWHAQLGTVVIAFMFLQALLAFIRPHPPSNEESKSMIRIGWENQHAWTGRIAIVIAWVVIWQGLVVLGESSVVAPATFYVYYAWLGVLGISIILLEIWHTYKHVGMNPGDRLEGNYVKLS